MRKLALAISCCLFAFGSHAQLLQPEFNEAFLQDEVATIKVLIHPDSLAEMLLEENLYLDHEYPATFIYSTEGIQDTLVNIGFRLRGNTSRQAGKKSFKVSFNTFNNNQSYRGLEKMNLNGEHNDVSIMRSKICWEMLREANLPSSRTSHVALYINDEYRGLYLNVEHIDEEFIDKRFGNKSGNLYKCIYGTNLQFLGNNPDAYKLAPWGQRIYELKTNTEADDYSGLARFIDVLNNSPEENFKCDLEAVFNVNAYLKTLVYEILFGHWDGYSVNQNNYYLYHNPADDRFYFLSYDLDNSLGV
ncbi:MAG: CotH kinase family protein, partial [Bacteroidetes bacterium]|nr:CotH kinase family protein [Bacteroidota bacterium]